jgi:ribonucleoside-diphosphate reductase alpha chain
MGKDISCNLGSLNIAAAMDSADFGKTIETSIRALTAVSDMSHISSVPSIERGNNDSHAIGLGQMNLHGYLARERIYYGSEEGVDFTNIYFYTVTYPSNEFTLVFLHVTDIDKAHVHAHSDRIVGYVMGGR